MKSFTKLYVLVLAMLVSFGMMAQSNDNAFQQERWQIEQQRMMDLHGPTLEVDSPVSREVAAQGDDCTDPIPIALDPGMAVWSTSDGTCGRGDALENTCLGLYDGGDDIFYELNVSAPMSIQVTFDPVETWSGIAIQDFCGDFNTCLYMNTGSGNTVRIFTYEFTAAGTYTLMIDSWPSPQCISFDLQIEEYIPPPPAEPIVSFPFVEDFEDCDLPPEMEPKKGDNCLIMVDPVAAYDGSSCGLLMSGTSYSWFYYSSVCQTSIYGNIPTAEGGTATGSYGKHYAKIKMEVVPDGTAGSLQLDFMRDQFNNYSFSDYYGAFQVWVNGTPIAEKESQEECFRGTFGGAGFAPMIYDLSMYQNDASFDLELVFIGAYAADKIHIDDLQIWYVPSGDVEGIAYDGDMSTPVGDVEVGFLADPPPAMPVMTDATTGYYKFSNIPTEPIDLWGMYAFLDGVNYVTADVLFITGVTVEHNWNIASPVMIVTPAVLEETMNPNEWRAVPISIFATAQGGPLHWTAEIVFGPPPMAPEGVVTINDVSDPSTPQYALLRGGNPADGQLGVSEEASRDVADQFCPEDAVFANNVVGYNNAYTISGTWSCQQQWIDVEDPISSLKFWSTYISPPAGGTNTYTIEVWTSNGSTPGTMEASYTVTMDGFLTSETQGGWACYEYDFEFPDMIDMEEGFIGLKATHVSTYWTNTFDPTASGVALQNGNPLPEKLSMCLGGMSGGGWLDLSAYEGDVASGESEFVNALFDATGTEAGQVWTADVIFTAQPNISTTTVDVSMIIAGEPLVPVDELTAELVNAATGQVDLAWTFGSNDPTFEYFLIRRDGQPIANTQNMSYTDMLPTYGEYCYTVSAVYFEGESVPAGPECVMWFIPELCTYFDNPNGDEWVYGEVWVGESETFEFTMENCGEGVLQFEFVGFDDPDFSMDFVTNVAPYAGTIPEGEMLTVMVTYDASGYGPGTYVTELELMTNELAPNNERMIACEMFVYTPATLYGTVTDCNDGFPISNVQVTATNTATYAQFTTLTASNGTYEMYVDAGDYDVTFDKLSLQPITIFAVNAPAGVMTEVSTEMCEVPYPVRWVLADPNEADTECMVTWSLPMGLYEIIYDDGTADNFFSWVLPGGGVAVKFTPAGYPTSVVAGKFYVGDGTFPEGANFLGSPMSVGVLDDDGTNGMPGTIVDSVEVIVNNYGWVEAALNGAAFDEGSFYVVMWQTSPAPFGAPIGVDETSPTVYRSRTKAPGADDWMMSAYNDFMIRAVVDGPGENVMAVADNAETIYPPKPADGLHIAAHAPNFIPGPELHGDFRPVFDPNADRDFTKYEVAFVDGFDPEMGEMPWDGTLNSLGNTTNNFYNDAGWGAQPPGFYAYAVRAKYESDNSIWVYSNVAAHKLDNEVTILVSQCDGDTADMASVILSGHNYPYQFLTAVTPAMAPPSEVVFDSVITGVYDLHVNKVGYQSYDVYDYIINNDMTIEVVLQENEYPPRNLYVDPLSSVATWDEPLYIQIPFQSFEDELFPPEGWQNISNSDGWERSNGYQSGFWTVPPLPEEGGEWFALAEDDSDLGDDCCTYLITPMADLREVADYQLTFMYFWNGQWGSNGGFVHYSLDGGATWIELEQLAAVGTWTNHAIDLSSMSGVDGESEIWFAFHYDDNGFWADGFAVDNVYLGNGPVDVQGYYVYLDEGFIAQTDVDTRTYEYQDLHYGQVYEAAVAALYGCNVSEKIYYTFTSAYLYPPRNLFDTYIYNTNEVPVFWNPPLTGENYAPMASYPKYNKSNVEIEYGDVEDATSFDRATAQDVVVSGSRDLDDVGDVLFQFAPAGFSLPWGAGYDWDNELMYLTDPLSFPNTIFEFDPATTLPTGVEFTVSVGQAWIGDMCYYDGILYAMMVGGPNDIQGIDVATGDVVVVIPGPWGISQRGVGIDYENMEFYGGGWNDNTIYHIDETGALIDQSPWAGISGLEYHPQGGPTADGSLWIMTNAGTSVCSEVIPSNAYLFTQDFNIPGNTSFSGAGLAMDVTGNLWIPNQPEGIVYLVDTEQPFSGGGPSIPDGLMEFKVYRDMMHVGTVPYDGERADDTLGFVDNPVDPGCWDYTVTAVYDLTDYGFPGQMGESPHEGPDTVCVAWGYDLPFMEAWDNGSFDFNGWRTDPMHNNWVVNSQMGNGAPSAQFNWDPDPGEEYSIDLMSAPLKADLYTEGKIWMDFEFMLDNRYSTGTEMLTVEVYDGSDWFQVAQFANTGDWDWTAQHLDITAFSMGRVFMVRFVASGMNSFDIINWNVDNIYIYRSCDAPQELYGDYKWNEQDDFGAELFWTAPELPIFPEGWIRWDNGIFTLPVGTTEGGDWTAAIRWDAGQLVDYEGGQISKLQYFMADNSVEYIKLKIWSGPNASTLLFESEEIMPDSAQWAEYTVDPPVAIDVFDELWVGYMVKGQEAQTAPAGMDEGPAITGYGDKISDDGENWYNASDLEIDGNWNLAAYVEEMTSPNVATVPLIDNDVYENYGDLTFFAGEKVVPGIAAPASTEGSRAFTGFNIYRMLEGEMEYTLLTTVPYEEGVLDYTYYDANPDPDATAPYEACYQITAVWESDTDYCESMPAMSKFPPAADNICILITSVDNPYAENVTALYPNPATDVVNITSSQSMTRLTVINYVGQVVYDEELNDENSLTMNAATLDAGVYIVKISTDNGVVTKRLTITK